MLSRRFRVTTGLIGLFAAVGAAGLGFAPAASAAAGPPSIARALAGDFQSAWQITRGHGVTVAVLSSGVDASVQTLAGAVTKGPDYVRLGQPGNIQGTLIASMIAGSGPTLNSPFGIRGLAPAANILSIRVYPDSQEGVGRKFFASSSRWVKALAAGIRFAAAHGAAVIYTDEMGYEVNHDLDSAVRYALARGCVIVATEGAAPSGSALTESYPAGIPGVIGVNAVDLNGNLMKKYSMASASVLVSAPGVTTPATGPANQPYVWWGGPVATAWVASAAALVKAQYPHLAPALVARAIAASARGRPRGSYKASVGFGVINPAGALAAARKLAGLTAAATPGQGAVPAASHFGGGPPAGKINAVQHNLVAFAAFSAVTVAGFACLVLAVRLRLRWRRAGADLPSVRIGAAQP